MNTNNNYIDIINKYIHTIFLNYYINNNNIYFYCDFNSPLDKYKDVIINCSHIIFSNYDNYDICIETKNQFNIDIK